MSQKLANPPERPSSWLKVQLFRRRTVWCPTWLGIFCLALLLAAPVVWCCWCGEAFLSLTERQPTDVLVVEGWIGRDGVRAAAQEFAQHGYKYIVTTGATTTDERWEESGWSFAEGAQHELLRSGIPESQIIVATAKGVERQRTFQSAVAVWRALRARDIHPKALNVFTWGPHARRSRLVFAKAFAGDMKIGVISWVPASYGNGPWWHSSERAKELLTEAPGYIFEAVFNSGRSSNSPAKQLVPDPNGQTSLGTKIAAP
jgi:uncharacterized SAM-binding protein YcdF (DUF218 family)